MSQADVIREFVNEHWIEPARNQKHTHFCVNSGDVQTAMEEEGLLPPNRYPNICSALQGDKIKDCYGVERYSEDQPQGVITVQFKIR